MRKRIWPGAVAAAAVIATAVYVLLGDLLRGPSVPSDETIYMEAARSLAHQGEPLVRGEPYGFGLLYPAVLLPAMRLASSQVEAYSFVKATNALLFTLAAVPVYLLGRRLLPPAWSFVVAVLAIGLPSALYTGLVFTENVAYPVTMTAFLLIALALERPTVGRQLAALGGIALAYAARSQFVVLAGVLVLAFLVRWALLPRDLRPRLRAARRLWPVGVAALVGGALLLVSTVGRGISPLGSYDTLARSYDLAAVARSTWYSLAGLELYLAFLPVVVAPAALLTLFRRGRGGSAASAAFLALFVSANALLIPEVGALMSTPFLGGLLHDRYLFYLVPLWLVLLVFWIDARVPLSAPVLAVGAALALALAATLPARLVVGESARLDGVATAIWVEVRDLAPERPSFLHATLIAAAVAAAAAAWLIPVRARALLMLPVVGVFVATAALVWKPRVADADRPVFPSGSSDSWPWVDDAVPHGAKVTTIWLPSAACPPSVKDAFIWTEFFNERVENAVDVGGASYVAASSDEAHVDRDGALRRVGGEELQAEYVVAPPGVRLRGTLVGEGTADRLGLWRVQGPVVAVGVHSDQDLVAAACTGSGSG